jgi:hypothetical protein
LAFQGRKQLTSNASQVNQRSCSNSSNSYKKSPNQATATCREKSTSCRSVSVTTTYLLFYRRCDPKKCDQFLHAGWTTRSS